MTKILATNRTAAQKVRTWVIYEKKLGIAGLFGSISMFTDVLELILGPTRDRMHISVFVAHDVEVSNWNGNLLGADS